MRRDDLASRQHVRERAAELTGADDGDLRHAVGYCNGSHEKGIARTGGARDRRVAGHRPRHRATRSSREGVNVAITARSERSSRRRDAPARRRRRRAGRDAARPTSATTAASSTRSPTTVSAFGGLDIVVNNAGVGIFANVADMTPEQWSRGHRHQSDRRLQRVPRRAFRTCGSAAAATSSTSAAWPGRTRSSAPRPTARRRPA